MSKLNIGDYVYVDYSHRNGTVIGDRGGHVGRWTVKMDDGDTIYISSRECTVIRYANPLPPCSGGCNCAERLDRLMDYLGLQEVTKPETVTLKKVKGKL